MHRQLERTVELERRIAQRYRHLDSLLGFVSRQPSKEGEAAVCAGGSGCRETENAVQGFALDGQAGCGVGVPSPLAKMWLRWKRR